jgi:hypothetical protein
MLPTVEAALAIEGSARERVSPALNLTWGSSGLRGVSSLSQGGESMIGIKQLRFMATHPLAAQPDR